MYVLRDFISLGGTQLNQTITFIVPNERFQRDQPRAIGNAIQRRIGIGHGVNGGLIILDIVIVFGRETSEQLIQITRIENGRFGGIVRTTSIGINQVTGRTRDVTLKRPGQDSWVVRCQQERRKLRRW